MLTAERRVKVCTGISGGGAARFFKVHSEKALQSDTGIKKEQRGLFLYRGDKHYIKRWLHFYFNASTEQSFPNISEPA